MPFFVAPLLAGSCSFLLLNYLLNHHTFVAPHFDDVDTDDEIARSISILGLFRVRKRERTVSMPKRLYVGNEFEVSLPYPDTPVTYKVTNFRGTRVATAQ